MFPSTVDLLTMPVMVAVGVGLLIYILGYSALVGLAVSPDSDAVIQADIIFRFWFSPHRFKVTW